MPNESSGGEQGLMDWAAETEEAPKPAQAQPDDAWNVLVVDDDESVLSVTRMVLGSLRFRGRGLNLLFARSGHEAEAILRQRSDVALVILDVVMETNDAGLRLSRAIREELGLQAVRIVLRTGQPGEAPEEQILIDYDINGYEAKTSSTARRLLSATITSLRSYEDIRTIERSKRDLRRVVEATDAMLRHTELQPFAQAVVTQFGAVVDVPGPVGHFFQVPSGAARTQVARWQPVASVGATWPEAPAPELVSAIQVALGGRGHVLEPDRLVVYVGGSLAKMGEVILVLETNGRAVRLVQELMDLFTTKVAIAFDQVVLLEQLRATQYELQRRVEDRNRELSALSKRLEALKHTSI